MPKSPVINKKEIKIINEPKNFHIKRVPPKEPKYFSAEYTEPKFWQIEFEYLTSKNPMHMPIKPKIIFPKKVINF
ncbi:MAG: hypothetical protein U9O55_02670 [Patescibacteria group bacterium]|nr:hypothetical protein [Patescibacteria group bacterium]